MKKLLQKVFQFLSSIKLAIIVLLALAYILALGTIQESLYGTAIAKAKVYDTLWFALVLTFLGINVFCAALSRWPWKKHHIGFLITHLGIISILIGSGITQKTGLDGSMAVEEGETLNQFVLAEQRIHVYSPDMKILAQEKLNFLTQNPSSEKPKSILLKDGSRLIIDDYYPQAQAFLQVEDKANIQNPAIQIKLMGLPSGAEMSQWLFLKNDVLQPKEVKIGPAQLSFLNYEDFKNVKFDKKENQEMNAVHSKGIFLEIKIKEDAPFRLSLEQILKEKQMSLNPSPYQFELIRYLPDAQVKDGKLINASDENKNPAIEFKVKSAEQSQEHTVFALLPDLEAVHGKKEKSKDAIPLHAKLIVDDSAATSSSAASASSSLMGALYFSLHPKNGKIVYKSYSKNKLSEEKELEVGKEEATGWMQSRFVVSDFYQHAQSKVEYRKIKKTKSMTNSIDQESAIHFKISDSQKTSEEKWLGLGEVTHLQVGEKNYLLRYGLRAQNLNFNLSLKKFSVFYYPGTDQAKSYESEVEVEDMKTKSKKNFTIKMNEPLEIDGYKIYQSSFQKNPGEKALSIFTVSKDPGKWVKYLGSILMVLGTLLMFYFKPLFMQKKA